MNNHLSSYHWKDKELVQWFTTTTKPWFSVSAWSMVVHWAPSLLAPKLLMFCLKLKNLPEMALIRYKTQKILEQFVVHTRIKKVLSKEIPHCWLCVSYLQMYVNLLFWYQFFCGFSGSVMTNSWVLILFNLIFTSAPPLIYGILNQDLPADTLMELPELYQDALTSKVTANTYMPQKWRTNSTKGSCCLRISFVFSFLSNIF